MTYEIRKHLKQLMINHIDDDMLITYDTSFHIHDYDHEISLNDSVAIAMIKDNDNKMAIEMYNAAKRMKKYIGYLRKIEDYRPEAISITPQYEKCYRAIIEDTLDTALQLVW